MADITKCEGVECPIKVECYRYTSEANEHRQAYFSESPGELKDNKFHCGMFWGENQNNMFGMLKSITSGKLNK